MKYSTNKNCANVSWKYLGFIAAVCLFAYPTLLLASPTLSAMASPSGSPSPEASVSPTPPLDGCLSAGTTITPLISCLTGRTTYLAVSHSSYGFKKTPARYSIAVYERFEYQRGIIRKLFYSRNTSSTISYIPFWEKGSTRVDIVLGAFDRDGKKIQTTSNLWKYEQTVTIRNNGLALNYMPDRRVEPGENVYFHSYAGVLGLSASSQSAEVNPYRIKQCVRSKMLKRKKRSARTAGGKRYRTAKRKAYAVCKSALLASAPSVAGAESASGIEFEMECEFVPNGETGAQSCGSANINLTDSGTFSFYPRQSDYGFFYVTIEAREIQTDTVTAHSFTIEVDASGNPLQDLPPANYSFQVSSEDPFFPFHGSYLYDSDAFTSWIPDYTGSDDNITIDVNPQSINDFMIDRVRLQWGLVAWSDVKVEVAHTAAGPWREVNPANINMRPTDLFNGENCINSPEGVYPYCWYDLNVGELGKVVRISYRDSGSAQGGSPDLAELRVLGWIAQGGGSFIDPRGSEDQCPNNPDKTEPGQCGCDVCDIIGDYDCNGANDFYDFRAFKDAFGTVNPEIDLTDDDYVGLDDWSIFIANAGLRCPN